MIVGLGRDERFARSGSTYLVDALGSTVALAASGAVQTSYGYDPYGVAAVTGTASTNPFQLTGREADGTGLLNYRNRYYNPAWGRFVSEDPIGLAGGINGYRYVNADPTDLRDPLGLLPIGSIGTPATGPSAGPAAPDGTPVSPAGTPRVGDPWGYWTNGRTVRMFDGNGNAWYDIDVPGHEYSGGEYHMWNNGQRGGAVPF